MSDPTAPTSRPYPAWLEDAVFYEIYPQTFYDANGDGIGDLPGISAKLDYLQSLGVDALWLNPCFVSPFEDAGYDVSDYYQVAPRYGTNADLEALFAEACGSGGRGRAGRAGPAGGDVVRRGRRDHRARPRVAGAPAGGLRGDLPGRVVRRGACGKALAGLRVCLKKPFRAVETAATFTRSPCELARRSLRRRTW